MFPDLVLGPFLARTKTAMTGHLIRIWPVYGQSVTYNKRVCISKWLWCDVTCPSPYYTQLLERETIIVMKQNNRNKLQMRCVFRYTRPQTWQMSKVGVAMKLHKRKCNYEHTLQTSKYDGHTKLPQWSYQIQIWYDHCGNFVWPSYFGICSVYNLNLAWPLW